MPTPGERCQKRGRKTQQGDSRKKAAARYMIKYEMRQEKWKGNKEGTDVRDPQKKDSMDIHVAGKKMH